MKDIDFIESKNTLVKLILPLTTVEKQHMTEPIIVTTTLEEHEAAERLARLLLEKKLIACAQILGPGRSLYWWQGKIVEASEVVLAMKTDRSYFDRIQQFIKAEHPYQVPEIVATAIVCGSSDYLDWLNGELRA